MYRWYLYNITPCTAGTSITSHHVPLVQIRLETLPSGVAPGGQTDTPMPPQAGERGAAGTRSSGLLFPSGGDLQKEASGVTPVAVTPAAAADAPPVLLVSKDSDASMVARALGWEVIKRGAGTRKRGTRGPVAEVEAAEAGPSAEAPEGLRSPEKMVGSEGGGADDNSSTPDLSPAPLPSPLSPLPPSAPLVTLRMGFGEALVKAVAAIAMAQGRVSEELNGHTLAAVPR